MTTCDVQQRDNQIYSFENREGVLVHGEEKLLCFRHKSNVVTVLCCQHLWSNQALISSLICLCGLICGATPPPSGSLWVGILSEIICSLFSVPDLTGSVSDWFWCSTGSSFAFSLKNFFSNVVFVLYFVPPKSSMVTEFPFMDTTVYGTQLNAIFRPWRLKTLSKQSMSCRRLEYCILITAAVKINYYH